MGKSRFDKWLWYQAATEVSHYHGENGIFTADKYRKDRGYKWQTQSISGVYDNNQNVQSEHAIQTIIYMMRSFMVNNSLHWTERGADALSLW